METNMKNHNRFAISMVICSFLLLSLQGTAYAKSMNHPTTASQLQNITSTSGIDAIRHFSAIFNRELPTWFPGFLLVQLIKGVIAFILVLLILFDIIESS